MADTKISALPASTVPLAGTEVLPIVQSSTTKQVSVANLTAGRSFDALGMTLTSTDAAAAAAPTLDLYRNSASPAVSDTLGEIKFNGQDSGAAKQQYAVIHGSILSPTAGAEQGQIHFETATAGASTEKMIIGTTNLVINDIGAVYNVRIEGDTDANLFYTDATNSRIGVGTITPAQKLDVAGSINLTGNVIVASGQGIDFSATPGTGTSELFADYEEGTWTPIDGSGAGLTYSSATGNYTKVGRTVTVVFNVVYPSTANASAARIGGLPFTAANISNGRNVGCFNINTSAQAVQPSVIGNGTSFAALKVAAGTSATNAELSLATLQGGITYFV